MQSRELKPMPTHRFPVGPDMVAEVRFISPDGRDYSLRDLMHLMVQIDIQRAMMAGEELDATANISTPERKAKTAPPARKQGVTVTFPEPGEKTPAKGTPPFGKAAGGIVGSLFARKGTTAAAAPSKTETAETPPAEQKTGTDG